MKLYKIIFKDVDEYNQPYDYEENGVWTQKVKAEEHCAKQNINWIRCEIKEFDSMD